MVQSGRGDAAARDSTDSAGFSAAVSAITDAFGDPTRRRVYLYVRDQGPAGATATAVASTVGVHPNVARHHLDKLAAGGYIEVAARHSASVEPLVHAQRRAGRPSKRYVAVGGAADEVPPVRSDDLVVALLGQALARLPRAEAEVMAEEVGATYGRTLAAGITGDALVAGQRSLRTAMQSVAAALTAHGFAARAAVDATEATPDGQAPRLRIINEHCPFGDLAIDHPVLCAVDRGLVRGMLSALYPDSSALPIALESSRAFGDTQCATAL